MFISQRNTSFDSRYKFTAKELDNETQYTYFGARYLDSEISIWLSVDPLSDKYPSLSPYAYCANNPVILVDTDGRKIKIVWRDDQGKKHKAKITNRSQLTQWQKSLTPASGEFANNVSKAINLIDEHDIFNTVNRTIYNKKTLTITESTDPVTAYREGISILGSETLYWNDNMAYESSNGEKQAPIVSLYHDIAEWSVDNLNSYSNKNKAYSDPIRGVNEEYTSGLPNPKIGNYDTNELMINYFEPSFINNLNKTLPADEQSQARSGYYTTSTLSQTKDILSTKPEPKVE